MVPWGWDIGPTSRWVPPLGPVGPPLSMGTFTKGNLYTYIPTDRQTDRDTDRQTDRQTEKFIKHETKVKYLGVILDKRLSWRDHINDKISTCKAMLLNITNKYRHTQSQAKTYEMNLHRSNQTKANLCLFNLGK